MSSAPRSVFVIGLFVVCTLWLCSGVSAQSYDFEGRLEGTVTAGDLHLLISLDWGYSNVWTVTPDGIDVYRRTVATGCGAWQRITAEPVPWEWQDTDVSEPHASFAVIDESALPGNAYVYQARPVDANRDPLPAFGDGYLGVATHGIALLGHGTLYGGAGGCGESYLQVIENCDVGCFPPLRFSGESEVEQYLNTDTPVLVYGVIESVMWTCQANETVAHLYSATPSSCVTATEETTWGTVKSLYR